MTDKCVRECVRAAGAYVPGEQPLSNNVVKLNTNESPFAPPFSVLDAILPEVEMLRLYPSPKGEGLVSAVSATVGVPKEMIVVGNGSDELLSLALRTFVNPGDSVAMPEYSYLLYETLAKQHGASCRVLTMSDEFDFTTSLQVPEDVRLVFVASPNPPRGNLLPKEVLMQICSQTKGVVVIDEAYVDFADDDSLELLDAFDNVVITRTLSKGYALAGLRVGFAITNAGLAEYLRSVRDSYSVDRIAQAVATKALEHTEDYRPIWAKIRKLREELKEQLTREGCRVLESDANFLLCSPSWCSAEELFRKLKQQNILVRFFPNIPGLRNFLRITVGDEEQISTLLDAVGGMRRGS